MSQTLQFCLDILLSALVLIIACTTFTHCTIRIRSILCIVVGEFLLTFYLFPIVGNFSTYLVVGYTISITLIGQKNKLLNCILGIIGYIYNVLLNYLCITAFYFITGLNIMEIEWHKLYLFNICYVILLYTTMTLIKRIFQKQLDYFLYNTFNIKTVVYFSLYTVICACILITNFASSQYMGYPLFSLILNCILFLIYFLFTVILLFQIIKIIKREAAEKQKLAELKNLQEYTGRLEDLYQQMRSFKHDYINILATLDCYIEQRDLDGLDAYFHSKLLPTGKHFSQDTASFERLTNIRLLELKSLLYQKFIRASSLSLQLEIDIPNPLTSSGSVEPVDLSRLLGIFLDNAIESAAETDERYLYCGLLQNEDSLIICLTNSCRMEGIPIEKLYENGFTTKDTGHGIGLFNAKEILNNYPDIIHRTECKNERFTQELCIPQGTC